MRNLQTKMILNEIAPIVADTLTMADLESVVDVARGSRVQGVKALRSAMSERLGPGVRTLGLANSITVVDELIRPGWSAKRFVETWGSSTKAVFLEGEQWEHVLDALALAEIEAMRAGALEEAGVYLALRRDIEEEVGGNV